MISEIGDLNTTTMIIIVTCFVWLGWDLYLYLANKETISIKIRKWSDHMLAISFMAGFLCGHWFW
jgi:hypothetical protein